MTWVTSNADNFRLAGHRRSPYIPPMAWIKQISREEAEESGGLLKRIYDDATKRTGRVFNILRIQSQNAPILRSGMGLYVDVMHKPSPVTRLQRELIATVVSRINNCHY